MRNFLKYLDKLAEKQETYFKLNRKEKNKIKIKYSGIFSIYILLLLMILQCKNKK